MGVCPDQALISPLSGLLGDSCNRIHIVAAGTLLWGAMTAAIGLSTTLQQVLSTLNITFLSFPDKGVRPYYSRVSAVLAVII
jgi:hypothetical protein